MSQHDKDNDSSASEDPQELIGRLLRIEYMYARRENYDKVVHLLDQALEEDKNNGELLLVKAFYLELGERYEEALPIYEELGNYMACARVSRALGKEKDAIEYEEKEYEERTRFMGEVII
jgi:tetratricopeptide (TPR) repeat protein